MEEIIPSLAKAIEETAKATGKTVDAVSKFGGFIAKYTHAPLEAGFGIISDKLNYMRWERQLRFQQRSEELLRSVGLQQPTRAVPLQFAVPLLQAASLEENDSLQDLWAALLVNAARTESAVEPRRAYISILEQLTYLDATVLSAIFTLPNNGLDDRAALTASLPNECRLWREGDDLNTMNFPPKEITLSLANLVRIGCLDAEEDWSGKKDYRQVYRTVLGQAFFLAVTLKPQR
jgi:hypothetical protein